MKEVHCINKLAEARVLLNPIRISLLDTLREPKACAELASDLGLSKQRVNNHLKEMLEAGLLKVVAETARRNLIEKTYQAVAKVYWLSPRLTRSLDSDAQILKDKLSLHNLLAMSERLQEDAATLLGKVNDSEVPSIGVTAEIRLRTADERERFTAEFVRTMHSLLEKYQAPESGTDQNYTAMIVCYPAVSESN